MTNVKKQYLNAAFSGSFSSLNSFFKSRKFKNKSLVRKELLKIPAYYYHLPAKKKFRRRKIISLFRNQVWGADLISLERYKNYNNGYKWILIIIDFFSRKMQTVSLKDKSGSTLSKALAKVFKTSYPNFLWVDQGKVSSFSSI